MCTLKEILVTKRHISLTQVLEQFFLISALT